jgi:hypothetical protein
VSKVPGSVAAPIGTATLKVAAIKIAKQERRTKQQFPIHFSNRFRSKDRADGEAARLTETPNNISVSRSVFPRRTCACNPQGVKLHGCVVIGEKLKSER